MRIYKKSQSDDKFSGNCGMFAIALGKVAKERNIDPEPVIVIFTNSPTTSDLWGDYDFYHVAVEINGQLYDGNGKTNQSDIAEFCYSIYKVSKIHVFYLHLDDSTISVIRQQTNWDTTWEYYYDQLSSDKTKSPV